MSGGVWDCVLEVVEIVWWCGVVSSLAKVLVDCTVVVVCVVVWVVTTDICVGITNGCVKVLLAELLF